MIKPGLLTTELWLVVLAVVNAETGALSTDTHLNYASLIAVGAYAVCRTLVKMSARGGGSEAPLLAKLFKRGSSEPHA